MQDSPTVCHLLPSRLLLAPLPTCDRPPGPRLRRVVMCLCSECEISGLRSTHCRAHAVGTCTQTVGRSLISIRTISTEFLDEVPERVANKARTLASLRTYPARSFLFHAGERSDSVLIAHRGLLRVDRTNHEGRRVLLDLAVPGDLVGELGVIDDAPRSANISTIGEATAYVLSAEMFRALMHDEPLFHTAVLQRVVRRLRALSMQLVQTSTLDAPARMATRIVRLVEIQSGAETDLGQPIDLKLPITQEELGEWAGLSREGAVKGIATLRSVGLIETGRKRIRVLDFAGLVAHAGVM